MNCEIFDPVRYAWAHCNPRVPFPKILGVPHGGRGSGSLGRGYLNINNQEFGSMCGGNLRILAPDAQMTPSRMDMGFEPRGINRQGQYS